MFQTRRFGTFFKAGHGNTSYDAVLDSQFRAASVDDRRLRHGGLGSRADHAADAVEAAVRLTDLNPQFLGAGGEGVSQRGPDPCPQCTGAGCDACHRTGKQYVPAPERHGVGVLLTCPCGNCDEFHDLYVPFENPIDGGPALESGHPKWKRTGDTFDTLTLTPSILRSKEKGGCGWHGYITAGEVTSC